MIKDDYYWWQSSDEKQLCERLFSYVKRLSAEQGYRQADNFKNLRLYGNLEAFALRSYAFYRSEPTSTVQNRVTFNIVQSMVDTVTSKLSKNKPKPTFLTEGGNWEMQRRAQRLTQFLEGQFQATKFYSKRAVCLQNAAIFGTGPLKIFRVGNRIQLEPIFVDELMVDDADAINGEPRSIYQRKYIHREVLKQMFPAHEGAIDAAGNQSYSEYASNQAKTNEMLEVYEAWHLPSSPESEDGYHAIIIENQTLYKEQWKRQSFPFVNWRWSVRPIGYWGQGLAEQLTGIQLEINKILRTIQVSMHLVSVPKLYVEAGSKIVSSHLNNKIGGIIKYAGTPPQEGKLGSIPSELFAHLDRLYTRAYEIAGISQLSAQSAKPAGLNSGKALREYNDIESERFLSVGARDEEAVIEVAEHMIVLAKEITEEFGEYKAKVSDSSGLKFIDWNEVNLDEDQYIMRVFPTSALSSTPAGRLQDVSELMQLGFVGKEDAMDLLNFPDLKQYYNFNNAGVEDIKRTIELIMDKNEYQTPEPYQNLEYGIVKMQQAYLMYKSQNAPEEKLELLRRWIEDANGLLKKATQDMQAQQAMLMSPQPPALVPETAIPAAPEQQIVPLEGAVE